MGSVLTLILVGLSVGLGNFAASVAIGLGGVSKSLRLRIAIVFGLFETLMPLLGLFLGQKTAGYLGGHANIIGGSLLALTGVYLIVSSLKRKDDEIVGKATHGWLKLLIAGISLSIDNLIIGFGLGARDQSVFLAAIVIGTTSVLLTLVGLELGNRLNTKVEEYSEIFSGAILILVGLLIGFKVL